MAIKDPLMFITIEEFKNWKGFNNQLFDEIITPDSEIRYAIEIASSNIDYLSGFTISKKWPEINPTKFTDNVQTATTHYVNFLLSKGVEYARGQASIGQGGIVYSQNNPEDPYFIPPHVFNYLREINEYLNIKGFNLKGIEPQTNRYFNKFISNRGEDSPLNEYIPYHNIKSLDDRTKITITNPLNMLRPVVNIDTNNIKSIDNLTTENLFQQYFSNDSLQLVDGKQGQKPKVISISDNVPNMLINELTYNTLETENKTISGAINEINKNSGGDSLWNDNGKNVDLQFAKDINLQGYNLVKLGDPILEDDAVNLRTLNNNLPNLTDYYKKEEVDRKIDDEFTYFDEKKQDIEDTNLQTESKQIVPAINELVTRLNNIPQWKEIAVTTDLLTINYVLKDKTHYRIYLNKYIKDITEIGTNAFVVLYFYYQIDDSPFPISNLEYSNNILRIKQGKLWKLEELQDNSSNYEIISNTLQIISPSNIECNKPLIIKSNSLNTNNPTENTWQIDLKNNIPQWKDVAFNISTSGYKNQAIRYDCKENKRYRIWFNLNPRQEKIIIPDLYTFTEFIYSIGTGIPQTKTIFSTYIKMGGRLELQCSRNQNLDVFKWEDMNTTGGNLWKLQELQE